jgi:hypothetical protein
LIAWRRIDGIACAPTAQAARRALAAKARLFHEMGLEVHLWGANCSAANCLTARMAQKTKAEPLLIYSRQLPAL